MLAFLTEEARQDVLEGASYYGLVRNRHGKTFDEELEIGLARIAQYPGRSPRFGSRFRRYKLRRFPYGILYCEEPARVIVTAVMHLRRHPSHWRQRER